jgi:hypothetical protein
LPPGFLAGGALDESLGVAVGLAGAVADVVGVGPAADSLTAVLAAGGGADVGSADPEQATTGNSAAVTTVTASGRRRALIDKLMG